MAVLSGGTDKQKREVMKKTETEADDELLPEYDLKKLRVSNVGPDRRRWEIPKIAEAGLKELREEKLTSYDDIETLMDELSHD